MVFKLRFLDHISRSEEFCCAHIAFPVFPHVTAIFSKPAMFEFHDAFFHLDDYKYNGQFSQLACQDEQLSFSNLLSSYSQIQCCFCRESNLVTSFSFGRNTPLVDGRKMLRCRCGDLPRCRRQKVAIMIFYRMQTST